MNINRRDFFKTTALGVGATALGIGATALAPAITLATEPELPLYKQFGWVDLPEFLSCVRYNGENNELEYRPFAVRTFTKLCPKSDIDYTNGNVITGENAHTANELLYKEAKLFGLTHLYCIQSEKFTIDRGSYRVYYIRGAKVPIEYKSKMED